MTTQLSAIETPHYEESRRALMRDPIIIKMAIEIPDSMAIADAEGNPVYEFMVSTMKEYERRGGKKHRHIGGPAEAVIRLKQGKGSLKGFEMGAKKADGREFSDKIMSDLLVSAWEGGSSYWVEEARYVAPKGMSWKALEKLAWESAPAEEREFWKTRKGVPFYALMAFLPPEIKWKVRFKSGGEMPVSYLTPVKMRAAGVKLAEEYPTVWARIKEENWDANDADVWLQLGVFGKVIFG